jgi:hypothetical protein
MAYFLPPEGRACGRALAAAPVALLRPRLDSARALPPLLYPLNAPEFVLGAGRWP